jgi:large subunit ribosomal protein L20
MARVKRGITTKARHKSVLSRTKGYRGRRRTVYRLAKQAVDRAKKNAYIGRKLKKRTFRSLWIVRLNAALQPYGIKYSEFIKSLNSKKIEKNRKELVELAASKPEEFKKIVEATKS